MELRLSGWIRAALARDSDLKGLVQSPLLQVAAIMNRLAGRAASMPLGMADGTQVVWLDTGSIGAGFRSERPRSKSTAPGRGHNEPARRSCRQYAIGHGGWNSGCLAGYGQHWRGIPI